MLCLPQVNNTLLTSVRECSTPERVCKQGRYVECVLKFILERRLDSSRVKSFLYQFFLLQEHSFLLMYTFFYNWHL